MESESASETDDEMFYPIVDLKEGRDNSEDEETNSNKQGFLVKSEEDDDSDDKKLSAKKRNIDHRKMARRKLNKDRKTTSGLNRISKTKKVNGKTKGLRLLRFKVPLKGKRKKNKDSEKNSHIKQEPGIENGFEFCPTDMKGVEELKLVEDIKLEVTSDTEGNERRNSSQKSDDDSDDDVPLSFLEKEKILPKKNPKFKKRYTVAQSEGNPWEGKKVKMKIKKLKIKKVKLQTNADGEVECKECQKLFKNKNRYRSHVWKVHRKPFSCGICSRQFHTQAQLEDHFNNHTGHRPYSCYLCDDVMFKSERSLKNHMKSMHSEGGSTEKKQYPCAFCPKLLSSATCLQEHTRLHTGEKPVTCQLCGKHFTRERDMKQHLNLHDEVWKCDLCQRCFLTPFKLKEHYRSHTGELPYECDKCDRKFARVADFRYHIGTHLGLKPYACELCGMRFTTSSSVTRHRLNMHQTGPKPHKCPQCSKRFHTETRLKTHIKNHENSKKFRCDLCPVARASLAELNKHAAIHGGEFRCDTCHRSCSTAERLAAHAARHDLEGKPYACFVCSLGYRSSQSLNKHLATVHKDEDIPKIAPQHLCTICGQVFEMKDKLNRHLKDSHVVICVGEIQAIDEPEPESLPTVESKLDVKLIKETVNQDKVIENQDQSVVEETSCYKNEKTVPIVSPIIIPAVPAITPVVLSLPDYADAKDKTVIEKQIPIKIDKLDNVLHKEDMLKEKREESIVMEKDKEQKSKEKLTETIVNKECTLKQLPLFDHSKLPERNVVNVPIPTFSKPVAEEPIKRDYLNHEHKFLDHDQKVVNQGQRNSNQGHKFLNNEHKILNEDHKFLYLEQKNEHKIVNQEQRVSNPIRNISITVPTISQNIGILDNFGVKDLSATSNQNTDILKAQKLLASRVGYDSPYMRVPYTDSMAAMNQQNRLLQHSYRNIEDIPRPNFEGYQQIQTNPEHVLNPWFLPAKSSTNDRDSSAHRQTMPRNLTEVRQRYGELRMPRLDALQMEQPDYRNFNSNNRQDITQLPSPHQRDISTDRKYYYNGTSAERKGYSDMQPRHSSADEKRKYSHTQPESPSNDIPARQSIREFTGQFIPNRDYNVQSPLGVRDLSNSTGSESHSPHYPHHFAPSASPHNFFQNFRDLQHRMLGATSIQDYGHPVRHVQLSGMDMTNQRLINPASPLSPYNHNSPHMNLDTLSPMSRHSYEDLGNSHTASGVSYQNNGQVSGRPVQLQNGESTQGKDSNEQVGPYEMRVAAN